MEKIIVNKALCIGCGACVQIDPEHFTFDDDGHSKAIIQEAEDRNNSLVEAIETCPTNAITTVEKKD